MSATGQYLKVSADIKKNRLYLTVAGSVEKSDLDRLYTDVRFCVADLTPGFDVITDLTSCNLGHLSALNTFRKIMHYLASHGVRDVIRIMNPDKLIHQQILNFAAQIAAYKSVWVASRQEAEELLEQSARRGNLRFILPKFDIALTIDGRDVTGLLLDISSSGCGISSPVPLPVGSELVIKLNLVGTDGNQCPFAISAQVVRERANGVAVVFKDLDDDKHTQLNDCLKEALRR